MHTEPCCLPMVRNWTKEIYDPIKKALCNVERLFYVATINF